MDFKTVVKVAVLTFYLIFVNGAARKYKINLAPLFDRSNLEGDVELGKILIVGFARSIYECVKSGNVKDDSVISKYFDFWVNEADDDKASEIGCAVLCASKSLDLVDTSTAVIKVKQFADFLRTNGADKEVLLIVEQVAKCYMHVDSKQMGLDDLCLLGSELLKCLRLTANDFKVVPENLDDVKMAFGG